MSFVCIQVKCQTSICRILYSTLSSATTLGQNGSGSDGSEGVLCIPQSARISGISPLDCLMSYPGHLLWRWGVSYLSAEMQLVYSTAPVN